MYDGSPEPKTYAHAIKYIGFQNWWGAMCVEFKTWRISKFGKSLPRFLFLKEIKSLVHDVSVLAKMMDATEHAVLQKGLVKFLEKTFK
jgi:hypothetical protein